MYKYQTEKPVVFTDDGQRHFLAILVELGEITEVTGPETAGQRRVFVRKG